MDKEVIIWLFGILGAWNVGITLALAAMRSEQIKVRVAVDIFIEGLGEKIAKALHSPDDHLGLDSLLDRYIDRSYELSKEEWQELHNRCREILNDHGVTKNERGLAGILAAVCEHKLQRYGVKPTYSKL